MDQGDHARSVAGSVGEEAARFRSGNEVAVQQYELRAGGEDFRESYGRAARAVPAEKYLRATGYDDSGRLQCYQNPRRRGGLHALRTRAGTARFARRARLGF